MLISEVLGSRISKALYPFTLMKGIATANYSFLRRYPGIACDIPSHAYSFTFEGNPEWSSYYAPGAEIETYLKRVAMKYDAYKYMQFRRKVTKAEWHASEGKWHVHLENLETGQVRLPN